MIFDNKLKQFINSQVRDSLLEMHMDKIVYVSNATEGDLMRDPDMEFIKGADGEYYPISFWQDSPLKRDEAVEWKDCKITGIKPKLQAELATFANTWMKNIQEQQGLVI